MISEKKKCKIDIICMNIYKYYINIALSSFILYNKINIFQIYYKKYITIKYRYYNYLYF